MAGGAALTREDEYRKLAKDVSDAQRRTAEQLERLSSRLIDPDRQTGELERLLKQVE